MLHNRHPQPTQASQAAKFNRKLFTITLALALAGCASNPADGPATHSGKHAPQLNTTLFDPPTEVPDFETLIALTPEQQQQFDEFFNAGRLRGMPPNQRIVTYLRRYVEDIRFENTTLDAATTIDRLTGNCMSLALVTTALAEHAGVEIGWQLAYTDPVFSSQGTVIYSANHIQTRLYEEQLQSAGYSFQVGRGYLLLDYFNNTLPDHGRQLRRHEMIALVYQNLGVEALGAGRLADAFWLLRAGLQHDRENPNLYNALGVAHRRAGDAETAEALYRFTLDHFGEQLLTLRNYRALLRQQRRDEEADRLQARIDALRDPDPYPMILRGDRAARAGRYGRALEHYRDAENIAPYLHEIYLKRAQVYLDLGDHRRAKKELRRARANALADSDQQLYAAKLRALSTKR